MRRAEDALNLSSDQIKARKHRLLGTLSAVTKRSRAIVSSTPPYRWKASSFALEG